MDKHACVDFYSNQALQKKRSFQKQNISYNNTKNLLVAQRSLPLPGDLKHIWVDMNKVTDDHDLHIKNNRDPSCH